MSDAVAPEASSRASKPPPSTRVGGASLAERLPIILWIGCGALCSVLFVGGLDQGSLWNSDDALYGYVVRQILETGDFGSTWFDYDVAKAYPLGMAWMTAVAWPLGATEASLRASSALACIGCLALFFLISSRSKSSIGAPCAAIVLLAGQPLFFIISQRVLHDGLMLMMFTAAMGSHLRAGATSRPAWRVASGVFCGLASLVKVGTGLLPLGVILLDLLIADRESLKRGWTWLGLAAALVIPLGYLAAISSIGDFYAAIYQRIFIGLPGHGSGSSDTLGFLSLVVDQGFQGIVVLTLASVGLVLVFRRRTATLRLLALWVAAAGVALAVIRTSLPQYSVMLLLPAALLAGEAIGLAELKVQQLRFVMPVVGLLFVTSAALETTWVPHLDDQVAELARVQAREPEDTYLCTIDFYHASPVFYADRKVEYLTESPRALEILRRTFGEATVPTLTPGSLVSRLNARPRYACITNRHLLDRLLGQLDQVEVIEPDPTLMGPDVVLIRRGSRQGQRRSEEISP
jgi:4-amino-4-deoxy-L-arabinose transferase-like glycosyltransferase